LLIFYIVFIKMSIFANTANTWKHRDKVGHFFLCV